MKKLKKIIFGIIGTGALFAIPFLVNAVSPTQQSLGGTSTSTVFSNGKLIYQGSNSYDGATVGSGLSLSGGVLSATGSGFSTTTINGLSTTNYTFTGTSPIVVATSAPGTINWSMPQASSTANGYLTSTDWAAFNGKGTSNLSASGTPGNIQFYGSSSALNANQLLTWDNTNGYLGVGTSNPAHVVTIQGPGFTGDSDLDIIATNGSDAGAAITLDSSQVGGQAFSFLSAGSNSSHPGTFAVYDNSQRVYAMYLQPTSYQTFGLESDSVYGNGLHFRGFNSGSRSYTLFSRGPGFGSGGFAFYDETGSAYRMFIDGAGYIGIGTTGPNANLDVRGTILAGDGAILTELSSDGTNGVVGTASNQDLSVVVNSSEKLHITTVGNVGIGTSTPHSLLTIDQGDMEIASSTKGVIMHDTTNYSSCYRIQVTSGILVPTSITCP